MTPLGRYVAEEIATDHIDGLLSRREALRRLGLLGLGTAAASALITACAGDRATQSPAASPASPPVPSGPPPGMQTVRPTEDISWDGPRGPLMGSWAPAENPRGAVLVIHENKGLNDWVRSVAGRLGGTAQFSDPAAATAALAAADPQRFIADMNSALDELQTRAPGQKLAAVGFCFGGGLVWRLLAAGESRLAAAVPFYGPIPDDPDFAGSKDTAVLGFYGSLDQRVTSTEPAAQAALDSAGVVNELVIEDGADHAFFNDSGKRYDPVAAEDAWQRLQNWFARYLW